MNLFAAIPLAVAVITNVPKKNEYLKEVPLVKSLPVRDGLHGAPLLSPSCAFRASSQEAAL